MIESDEIVFMIKSDQIFDEIKQINLMESYL